MRYLLRSALAIAAIAASAACGGGGGDDDGGGGPGGQSNMSARVDGNEWSGLGNAARSAGGIYTVTGADGTDGISLQLYNIPGPGTYALGLNATGFGGTAIFSTVGAGWGTPLTGLAGSVTITTLTDTRIVGTFHYDATPLNGTASGTVEVTEGEFDMLLQTAGAWSPPDPWDGSRLNGRAGTDTVIGATMAVVLNGDDLLFTGHDMTHVMAITLQDLAATGAFTFHDTAPIRRVQLTDINGTIIYLTDSTSTGNITVTSMNANRIAGSYTATLKRLGAAGTINVSGTFDVGIPHF
jgi:hypothetical protein